MRNGDLYKIRSMHASGTPIEDICNHFRNKYDAAEVKRFLPEVVSESETSELVEPELKPKKAKRRTAATE